MSSGRYTQAASRMRGPATKSTMGRSKSVMDRSESRARGVLTKSVMGRSESRARGVLTKSVMGRPNYSGSRMR